MKTLNHADIRRELSGFGITARCLDNVYGVIEHKWLIEAFLPFWKDWLFSLGISYTREVFDCDKYARLFQSQMHISAAQAKAKYTGIIAMMVIPGHALNIVKTGKGWFQIEPQTSVVTPLSIQTGVARDAIF